MELQPKDPFVSLLSQSEFFFAENERKKERKVGPFIPFIGAEALSNGEILPNSASSGNESLRRH